MKKLLIAILIVLLLFYITNPTSSEFESFLTNEIEKEIGNEESNNSKIEKYIDEIINFFMKEEIKHSVKRDNYYFFSLYTIDSIILEGEFIGIFRLFIPIELSYKSFDELTFNDKEDKAGEEKTITPTIVYNEYELGEMYSNIATENKIAKFNVLIEYTKSDVLTKIKNKKTKIQNNIYEIMRRAEFKDVQKPTGQKILREEIRQMIIETTDTDRKTISNIYFTEFIIQG